MGQKEPTQKQPQPPQTIINRASRKENILSTMSWCSLTTEEEMFYSKATSHMAARALLGANQFGNRRAMKIKLRKRRTLEHECNKLTLVVLLISCLGNIG